MIKNQLLNVNKDWKLYLDSSAEQMQADIRNILANQILKYGYKKSRQDIAALFFQYEYETWDIVFWAEDKNRSSITDTIILPSKRKENSNGNSNWNHFIPETLWNKVAEFEDNYRGDDSDDIICEYIEVQTEIFKKWFLACWNTATKGIGNVPDAYFSIHDTYFLTDLKTGKKINNDEISKRYE